MHNNYRTNIPFSTEINLSSSLSLSMEQKTINEPTTFTLITHSISPRGKVYVRLISDSVHFPVFQGFKQHSKSMAYSPEAGVLNLVEFSFDGHEAFYRIYAPISNQLTDEQRANATTLSDTTISVNTTPIISVDSSVQLGYDSPSDSFTGLTYAGYVPNTVFPHWTYVDEMHGMFIWNNGTRFGFQGRYEKNTPDRTDDTYNWLFGELAVPYDFSTVTNLYDSALGTPAETTYNTNLDIDPEETYLLNGRYEPDRIALTAFVLNPTTKRFQYSSRSFLYEGNTAQAQRMGGSSTGTYWYDSGWKLLRANADEIFTIDNRETMSEPYRFMMHPNTFPEVTQEMFDAQLTRERTIPTMMQNMINVQFNGNGRKLTWATRGVDGRVWEVDLSSPYNIESRAATPRLVDGSRPWPSNFVVTAYDYRNNHAAVSGYVDHGDGNYEGRIYMFEREVGTFSGLVN